MVKKFVRIFAYMLLFILALLYFMPKTSIYYFAEHKLKEYGVVISSEEVTDTGFSLVIEGGELSVKSVESAHLKRVELKILALYNSVYIEDITLSSALESFVPLKIQSININYNILNPLNAKAEAIGDFGEVQLSFNIFKMSLHATLKPSSIMHKQYKSTLSNLKKNQEGEFIYDKNF